MTTESPSTENELDIRRLFLLLWQGKRWIIGLAAVFACCALIYSYLVKQEWTSVAIMTKPSVTALANYYSDHQFLIDSSNDGSGKGNDLANVAYKEFLQQLGSYDARKDFWLQSDYYIQRVEGNSQSDTALLYEFIDNITLNLSNPKSPTDSIQMIAETGEDACTLLNQYIQFVSQRTVKILNQELNALWLDRQKQLTLRVQQLKASAQADYARRVNGLKQEIELVQKQSALSPKGDFNRDALKLELDALSASGPQLGEEYYRSQLLLAKLIEPLTLTPFQPYRFLRTPDEPIKRSKPRRLFLLILWGSIGGFLGAGVALTRRKS